MHLEGVPGPANLHSYALASGAFLVGLRAISIPAITLADLSICTRRKGLGCNPLGFAFLAQVYQSSWQLGEGSQGHHGTWLWLAIIASLLWMQISCCPSFRRRTLVLMPSHCHIGRYAQGSGFLTFASLVTH